MTLQIIINVATKPDGAPGVPREFPFVDGDLEVTLKLPSVVGITSFAWEILDQDGAASAVLDDAAAAEPKFTMTAGTSGTYLCRCVTNGGADFGDNAIGILTETLGLRKPAASETTIFNPLTGWKQPMNEVIDQLDALAAAVAAEAADTDWKESVRVLVDGDALAAHARTGNVVTADANGALVDQDGIPLVVGNSLLLDYAAPNVDGGIFVVTTLGDGGSKFSFTRREDFDEDDNVTAGIRIPIEEGAVNEGLIARLLTVGAITINATALDFEIEVSSVAAHAGTHQNGGGDELNVAGLSGVLADPQTPDMHAADHQNGGGDELDLAGMSGLLATPQTPASHALGSHSGTIGDIGGDLASASRPPNGSAGGDLTGSYPNPTLGTTGITPGAYTSVDITVDAKGRITSIANGAGGGGGGLDDFTDDSPTQTVNAVTAVVATYSTVEDDSVATLLARVWTQDGTSNDAQKYLIEVVVKRDGGGTVTVVAEDVISMHEDQSPATFAVTFIVNGDDIDVTVLGIAGQTIEWRCQLYVNSIELGGG